MKLPVYSSLSYSPSSLHLSNSKLVKELQAFLLKENYGKFQTTAIYEWLSKHAGYKNWNVARAKKAILVEHLWKNFEKTYPKDVWVKLSKTIKDFGRAEDIDPDTIENILSCLSKRDYQALDNYEAFVVYDALGCDDLGYRTEVDGGCEYLEEIYNLAGNAFREGARASVQKDSAQKDPWIEKRAWALQRFQEKGKRVESTFLVNSLMSKFKISTEEASAVMTYFLIEGRLRASFIDGKLIYHEGEKMTPEELQELVVKVKKAI